MGLGSLFKTIIKPNPLRLIWGGFFALITTGSVILWLIQPNLDFIDALFTGASAVCVTGLIVKSTGNDFHFVSQLWLLLLIQIGGVGFMSTSVALFLRITRRASLTTRDLTLQTLGANDPRRFRVLIADVFRLTLWCEGIGALILFPRFWLLSDCSIPNAIWQSVFHSVSAFCNAGFSLFDTSLEAYVHDPVINLVIGSQIIIGGIGFPVTHEIFNWLRRKRRDDRTGAHPSKNLSFHTKLVLTTTAILIFGGAFALLVFEWKNPETFGSLPLFGKIQAALFQSVTARTAGFNTVSLPALSNASILALILLMFIGAGPGSCAGGIKVTTFGSIALVAFARLRGRRHPTAFNREISDDAIGRAMSLVGIATGLILIATVLLMTAQEWSLPGNHPASRGFIEYLFEAVSAFGTVGLSIGLSGPGCTLTVAGKLIIVGLMFVGRVGPLILFHQMANPTGIDRIRYPSETPAIG
jgi:trk system potassium uptake protein TrkH